jgi:hypothetical protein
MTAEVDREDLAKLQGDGQTAEETLERALKNGGAYFDFRGMGLRGDRREAAEMIAFGSTFEIQTANVQRLE